ncbi:MAG: IPT/TIG domain-containing protein [Candidatus Latescibacteria bacterium]|nr:IPT/TIG domain-containing protein [Candidatus Latescibacterota bacterium]
MRKSLFFAVILPFLLIIACSDSNPTGPDDNGSGSGTVLETKKQKIDSAGGTISLSDGSSVVFPAGAISSPTDFTLKKIAPDSYFDGDDLERIVLSCTGNVNTFNSMVEIRVPLPDGMTAADSSRIFAGLIDDESGAVTIEHTEIRMIDNKPVLVLPTKHFSNRLLEWFVGPTPPDNYGPLTVTYFNQGSSNYCWATSLQMVTEAVNHDNSNEIFDIIGKMGVDESGITAGSFRFSSTLAGIVSSRTGVKPDRMIWDYINVNNMKDYLKREIGVRQHPVALFNGVWEHAVVIVGYTGNTFYIHDPASTTSSSIGYTSKTWDQIAGGIGLLTNMVTLSIPKSIQSPVTDVTVNIMPDAFDFIRPAVKDGEKSNYYRFKWDYTKSDGYSFKEDNIKAVDVLPAEVTVLKQTGDIEIYNASRTESKTVSVWIDISASGAPKGEGYYSENKLVNVGPNSLATISFDEIEVDEFRWNSGGNTQYLLSITTLVSSTTTDRAQIFFKIPPVNLEIAKISPESGSVGTEVTIKGTGFGIDKDAYLVIFGVGSSLEVKATEIVSWKSNEIVVKVPAKASTGNIEIRENVFLSDKKSNGVLFTITDSVTYSATEKKDTVWSEYGTFASFTANWQLTGSYPDTTIYNDTYTIDHFFNVKTQTPATLLVDISAKLKMDTRTIISAWDSTQIVHDFHDLKPIDAISDPEDDETCIRVNGTFPYTVTGTNGHFTLECNLNRGDYYPYDYIQLMPLFEYQMDTRVYSIKAANYGALLSTELNKRNVLRPVPISFRIGVNTRWQYWPEE